MSAFLVTDSPRAVEPHHRVVVWLGADHGPIPGKVTLNARAPDHFLHVAMEHVLPGLIENFECAVTGPQDRAKSLAEYLLERYRYISRQATFDLNTMRWTYKRCALQSIQKVDQLPDQIRTIKQLSDRHRDKSCVIIGAGPSLDISTIDPEKILTIASLRSALICLKAGWCPDYIIHVDPDPFEDALKNVLAYPAARNAQWILPFQVHRGFVNLPGQSFWFGSRLNPVSVWISKQVAGHPPIPLVISGGSVSCVAFTIADIMGCSPICLIGQDLCYEAGRKYGGSPGDSAGGIDRFTSMFEIDRDTVFLQGINGENVQTTIDYATYAEWFKRESEISRRKLFNCTTRGVFLPGFEHAPIEKVYERYAVPKGPSSAIASDTLRRPDVRAALARAEEICATLEQEVCAGNYESALSRLRRMSAQPDADGFFLTSCTQYESKITSYFSHLPPSHPRMKRCIDLEVKALRAARADFESAVSGVVDVPPITEQEIQTRMSELIEITKK